MENRTLTPEDIINVFANNSLFAVVETPVGKCVKMPTLDAFIFNDITGSGYLDNPIFPYTTKGLLKIYYNALDYNRVSGVFENNRLSHTPRTLSSERPFLFDSDFKYILPISFRSESELQVKLERIFNTVENPTDYIIMRIEAAKKGGGLESFMEYIACLLFRNNGYIVENQVPLSHSTGSPDFEAVKLHNIQSILLGRPNSGFYTLELSLKWLKKDLTFHESLNNKEIADILSDRIIVGEAKTSTTIMESQVNKYLRTGYFDSALEMHPSKKIPSSSSFGIMHFLDNYKIEISAPSRTINYSDSSQKDYKRWLENYYKTYLFINLDENSVIDMMNEKGLSYGKDDISQFINNLTYKEILERI